MMKSLKAALRFQAPATLTAHDNDTSQQGAEPQLATSSNPSPSSSRVARLASALRNRVIRNQAIPIRAELRGYVKTVQKNPESAEAFVQLGSQMTPSECVVINGTSMNQQACYLKAAQLDPQYVDAFIQRGNTLTSTGRIDVNHASMTEDDCYQEGLKKNNYQQLNTLEAQEFEDAWQRARQDDSEKGENLKQLEDGIQRLRQIALEMGEALAAESPPVPVIPQTDSITSSEAYVPAAAEKAPSLVPAQPLTADETEDIRKFLGSGIDVTAFNTWNASISNPNASLAELVRNADKLVSISSSKRLVALAKADYAVPEKLIDYYRTLTQTLESVYTNAQAATYGLFQHSQSPLLKALGAVSSAVPAPGASVLSSLLVAGIQQNIEVNTVNELKKILACFGDSADFLAVTNAVAKNVCIGKRDELEAYKEDKPLTRRSHGAGLKGRDVPSPFALVNMFKKVIQSAGMAHQGNLSARPLQRKAIDDVGTLVDAMIGMSDAETDIMLQDRVRWMTAKLGITGAKQMPDPAIAGPSNRAGVATTVGATAEVPTELDVGQMMREFQMLKQQYQSALKRIDVLERDRAPQDGFVTVAGRGSEGGLQAQLQVQRQPSPFDHPELAGMRQQVAVNVDLLNQLALGQAVHEERLAKHDAAAATNG